jgi:hypothetical protein
VCSKQQQLVVVVRGALQQPAGAAVHQIHLLPLLQLLLLGKCWAWQLPQHLTPNQH